MHIQNPYRRRLLTAAAAGAALPWLGSALAQGAYPSRPLRVVIPFPAGGPTDVVGRVVTTRMGESMQQSVVIENRGGASGTIGADLVAKAAPDGYTLLINVSAHVINPWIYARLPHDPMKDFTPITAVASTPIQLVVSAELPVHSVEELVAYVKARPGTCSFASSSNGTPGHLAGEVFKMAANLDTLHAPYRGSAPALTDVMGGQITYMFDSMPSSLPLVKGGRLRSLGVTGTRRVASLPDVPTMVEAGYADMTMTTWYGMWAPARTPSEVVARIHAEVAKALAAPDIRARLADVSAEGIGDSPAHFADFCRSESERYGKIVKAAGIRIE